VSSRKDKIFKYKKTSDYMEVEEKATEEHKELLEQDISDYFMMEITT